MVREWHFKLFLQTDQAWSPDQMTEINPGGACRGAEANS